MTDTMGREANVDVQARQQARATWNARACGEMEGEPTDLGYFLRLERERARQEPWLQRYLDFSAFAGQRVLEIGIGQGTDLAQFALHGAVCHGIDITENHLRLTQDNFDLRGLTVELKRCDAIAIEYPTAHFDCVYSVGVLHHVPEIDACFAEVFRVLRPGGLFLVGLYHRWSAFFVLRKLVYDGLRRGQLFSLGWRGLLATVEGGADGRMIKPFVETYSRGELSRRLSSFVIEDIGVRGLSPEHFYPPVLARWAAPHIDALERRCGWYVVCKARKPQ